LPSCVDFPSPFSPLLLIQLDPPLPLKFSFTCYHDGIMKHDSHHV
jgi:hypothetical protein